MILNLVKEIDDTIVLEIRVGQSQTRNNHALFSVFKGNLVESHVVDDWLLLMIVVDDGSIKLNSLKFTFSPTNQTTQR